MQSILWKAGLGQPSITPTPTQVGFLPPEVLRPTKIASYNTPAQVLPQYLYQQQSRHLFGFHADTTEIPRLLQCTQGGVAHQVHWRVRDGESQQVHEDRVLNPSQSRVPQDPIILQPDTQLDPASQEGHLHQPATCLQAEPMEASLALPRLMLLVTR